MATVSMPQLGESVTEGTILQWLKKPGDPVAFDDSLCEIETEKVTAELPSPFEGTMGEIFVPEGETVDVGARLCDVVEAGVAAVPQPPAAEHNAPAAAATADLDDDDLPPATGNGWSGGPMAIPKEERAWAEPEPLTEDGPLPRPEVVALPVAERERPVARAADAGEDRSTLYSPAVMRLARERRIDLATVQGTGLGGRVTKRDIEEMPVGGAPAAKASPAVARTAGPAAVPHPPRSAGSDGGTVVPFSATRKTIAARLTKSNLEAPQAWTMIEADVTALMKRRERDVPQFERSGLRPTPFHYFVEAVCKALRDVPEFNARWEGADLVRHDRLNLGVAVSAEHGLVVPVLKDAGSLSLEGIVRGVGDLAERARTRKLRIEDIEGGTFTVNNTGAFGSIASKPIVNHPEVAIVTFERAVKRPVVVRDAIAVRWMVNCCLSFDHRVADGTEAGRFLAALKRELEREA